MTKPDNRKTGLYILVGVGAAGIAGAAIGLALARRAGRQTRTEIAESVDDLKERAQHVLSELTQNVNDLASKSAALLDQARVQVEASADAATRRTT